MAETLAQKICTPCRGGIPPLTPEEAAQYAGQLQDWAVKDESRRLERTYRFGNFREALAFVDHMGVLAEAQGHHPDVCFGGAMRPFPFRPRRSKACTRMTSSSPPKSTSSRHPRPDRFGGTRRPSSPVRS
jgi:4a-hydroxytetrahydrobiopterin dehydratase